MQQSVWGWLIVIYLFLGGLGAGAFLASALAYKNYLGKINDKFYKFGFLLAPISVIVGILLLVFDLAPSAAVNPFKILQLYSRPVSMMSIGTYLLTFFIIVSAIVYLKIKNNQKLSNSILILGLVLAIGVIGYTGFLLYVVKSIPLWTSIWLPIVFTISAISTGFSANAIATLKMGYELTNKAHKIHTILIALEVIAILGLFIAVSDSSAGYQSVSKIIMGSLAPTFWIGFVVLGLGIPLFQGVKHVFVACDENNCCNNNVKSSIFSEISVLIGGFCLRAFIIFGAFYIF